MKVISLYSLLICLVHMTNPVLGQEAPENEELTQDQIEALKRNTNLAGNFQVILKQKLGLLETYVNRLGNEMPNSWEDIESELGPGIWDSAMERAEWLRTFALLPGISGQMKSREGDFSSELVVVMTAPSDREYQSGRNEVGRWVVWRTEKGAFAMHWHLESEIQSFTAWDRVQREIDQHLMSLAAEESNNGKDDMPEKLRERNRPHGLADGVQFLEDKPISEEINRFSPVNWAITLGLVAMIGIVIILFRSTKRNG